VGGIYVGPGDLSLSLGIDRVEGNDELRGVLSSIIARAAAAHVPVGVHAYNGEDAAGYAAEGATIVTVGADAASLADALSQHLDVARGRAEAQQAGR